MNDEFMTNLQKSASDLVKLAGMECFHAPDGVCSGCLALAMEEVDIEIQRVRPRHTRMGGVQSVCPRYDHLFCQT